MRDFDEAILNTLESSFDASEIETLMFMSDAGEPSYAIKIVHQSTGIEVISSDFDSQIKNKALALAKLLAQLHKD